MINITTGWALFSHKTTLRPAVNPNTPSSDAPGRLRTPAAIRRTAAAVAAVAVVVGINFTKDPLTNQLSTGSGRSFPGPTWRIPS